MTTSKNARKQSKQPPNKKGGKKRSPASSSFNASSYSNAFACALRDPFSPMALGTRVPDPFSFPTATHHLHGEIIAGNASTNGALMFLPNPNFSMVDFSSSAVISVGASSMRQYTNTTRAYGATTPAVLGAIYGEYRVASWGLKISNLMPELGATGRIIIAPFVIGDTVPDYTVMNSSTASGGFPLSTLALNTCGYTSTSINSSAVLNMPDSIELSVQDLLHGSLEIGCSVVNPIFFSFKTAQPSNIGGASGNINYFIGDSVATPYYNTDTVLTSGGAPTGPLLSTTAAPNVSIGNINEKAGYPAFNSTGVYGFKDSTRCQGGVGWIVYYEGLPTENIDKLLIEYIYHLEGTANLANADSKLGPVSSVPPLPYVGNTAAVEAAMAVNSAPNVISWITQGAQFLNKASKDATGKGILGHAMTLAGNTPYGAAAKSIVNMFKRR